MFELVKWNPLTILFANEILRISGVVRGYIFGMLTRKFFWLAPGERRIKAAR